MKKNNIFNGIVALLISQVVVKIFGVLYKLYLANKTGFGDWGNAIYNSGYQIYALLLTISSIGVPNAVSKMIAESKKNSKDVAEVFKGSLIVFSVIGMFSSLLLVIFAGYISENLLNIPESKKSIIALAPAIFNVCIISVYRGYFNGINKIDVTAKSQTVEQILKTIFTFTLVEIAYIVTSSNTVMMAAFANFATTLATLGSFMYLYKKSGLKDIKVKFRLKKVIKILYISIPISLSSILASLNRNIDSITIVRYLKNFIGENSAKIQYGILSGKVDVVSAVPVSFIIAIATTIIPTIAELKFERKYTDINRLVKTYLIYTILIVVPCSFCMISFSDQILEFLFGSNSGSILLKISAISMIFISLEQIVNAVLQGIGKVFVPAVALGLGVCAKIILNIKLLNISPTQYWYGGIVGCCIATLFCHIIAFFISFSVMRKKLKINFEIFKFVLKPIIASCIMAMCLYYTYFLLKGIIIEKIAIILAGIVAIITYIIMFFLLKILSKDELSSIPIFKDINLLKKNKKYKKK